MKSRRINVIIISLMTAVCFVTGAYAEEGDTLWTHTYGYGEISSIIPSGDGNYLLVDHWDAQLIKIDSEGEIIWSKTYLLSYYGERGFSSIISTGDGHFLLAGFVTAGVGDDMAILKVDAQGDSVWYHHFGGTGHQVANAIAMTNDGGCLLVGKTRLTSSSEDEDIMILKVNSTGDSVTSRIYGGIYHDAGDAIIPSTNGNFIVAGSWGYASYWYDVLLLEVNSQGDSLSSNRYRCGSWDCSIIPSGDGNFLIAGETASGPGTSMGLLKVSPQGDSIWAHYYGGDGNEGAYSITSTADNCFFLAGYTSSFGFGSSDMYLVKVDFLGNYLQQWTYGGTGIDKAYGVIPAEDGHFLLAGETGTVWNMYLVKVEGPPNAVDPIIKNTHPESFFFFPPSPNPFNPTTTIRFDLPQAARVTLEVFDINGRCVTPSGSGTTPTTYGAGSHEIQFDGSGLPSGVYIYRLTAGPQTSVGKMVLLK